MAGWLAASGCLGPAAVRFTRMQYNEAVRSTNDEQLLTNLVRLRYADTPVFVDLPNITSQFELAAGGSDPGPSGSQTNFGVGGAWGRDSPTLSYHPRQGREIAKALLDPLSPNLYSVVNAGARLDQLMWMTLNDINDVQNAARAATLVPRVPDDNTLFLRGIQLLAEIDDRGGAEIGFSPIENKKSTSDPVLAGHVQGRDVLDAARGGYVYRDTGDGRMALYKRESVLTLKIRSPFTHSPEMEEMARIFNLTAGLPRYKIESELEPGAESTPPSALPVGDTIYLNLRSILQIMTFLSKGVCIPDEHIRNGVAPMTPDADGRPFDWTRITAGNFVVDVQKHRPRDAEVAVPYRGYWFYIRRGDVNSRSVLAVLEILFSLQESDEKSTGPVLTLPAGR
ncbi:MAG TPA: hypothetical protein VHS97_13690 [Isosphaeraceae bacterium]|nr:hypothetical protein [Isosphaeraceae bacterium]